jgi:integrase
MSVKVRKYVKHVVHGAGCAKLRTCGCPRVHDGWEYYVKVRFASGQVVTEKRRVPLDNCTRAKAERYAQEREAELYRAGPAAKEAKKAVPTVEEFAPRYIADYCEANRQKPSTIIQKKRIVEHYLKPRVGTKKLDEVTDFDVQKVKADLRDLSPKTTNNALVCLNGILKRAVEWHVIDRLPCTIKLLKVPKIVEAKFYEPHEYQRLVEAAGQLDPRIELFVLLGGDAGLRCGEIIALEQSDVDLRRGYLVVRRSEWEGYVTAPKSGHQRKVNLSARLKAALARNRHMRGDRVLWRDDGREKVTQVLLAKWMSRAQRRAGLKVTGGIHILRHTFCSRLAMAGASTKAIQELAGHEELKTTQRYMHLSPAAKSEAISLLDRGEDLKAEGEQPSGGEAEFGDRMATARGSSDSPGPSGT